MISSITLDDSSGAAVTLHETNKRAVRYVSGFAGVGSLRDSRRVRPSAHGGIDETRYEDGRLMVVQGAVWSQVSQADAWAEWTAISGPMLQTLDVAPALIKWTRSDSVALQRLVRLADAFDPPIQEGAALLEYQAQFYAEDPRAYSQTLTTRTGPGLSSGNGDVFADVFADTFDAGAGGAVAVSNAGNRPTSCVLRLYGYLINPVITLVGAGKAITVSGVIAPGDYLELDTQTRTATLNGTSPAQSYIAPAGTTWFDLPAGSSTVQLTAGTFDTSARCDVLFRSAYA